MFHGRDSRHIETQAVGNSSPSMGIHFNFQLNRLFPVLPIRLRKLSPPASTSNSIFLTILEKDGIGESYVSQDVSQMDSSRYR